jgi:hypothetical protein
MRQAMDGQYASHVNLGYGAVHGPFNTVLQATHRQNFSSLPGPIDRSLSLNR